MQDHTKTLSTSQGAISVKRCGCGGIHVCLGGISINLAQETAQFLKDELEKAVGVSPPLHLVTVVSSDPH